MKKKSVFETDNPTEAQIREQIQKEFGRWNEIAANGSADPYWEDGVNMSLVRAHILYWYNRLADCGFTLRTLFGEFPEEKPVPPEVPYGYMVKGGRNADRLERTRTQAELDRIVWGYPGEYAV